MPVIPNLGGFPLAGTLTFIRAGEYPLAITKNEKCFTISDDKVISNDASIHWLVDIGCRCIVPNNLPRLYTEVL